MEVVDLLAQIDAEGDVETAGDRLALRFDPERRFSVRSEAGGFPRRFQQETKAKRLEGLLVEDLAALVVAHRESDVTSRLPWGRRVRGGELDRSRTVSVADGVAAEAEDAAGEVSTTAGRAVKDRVGAAQMKIGYFLSCEEWGPKDLISQAVKAQEAGFEGLWISDHYHPWNDEQGHSSFVWATIGAIAAAAPGMRVTTAVTCPTMRIHPAVIAQAAATTAVLLDGRFALGVGSGEALNEHIFGDAWPNADERLEMLEESIEVIRTLWQGGAQNHRGRHYRVDHARVYDLPDEPTPILISGFGPKAIKLAGRVGDGFCTVAPDAEAVGSFRSHGGEGKLVHGGTKVCFGQDEQAALAHVARLWPNEALPGELAQILPTPEHFEQAAELVTSEMLADAVVCGPDIDRHVAALQEYADAGFDELYVNQIGPDQDAFFSAYSQDVLPRLR